MVMRLGCSSPPQETSTGGSGFSHGEYLSLGKKLGTFGYSVRKKKPGKRKK